MREEHVFIIVYALVGSYFAGVMVRLMLTLTPVVCLSAAMVISRIIETYVDPILPSSVAAQDSSVHPGLLAQSKTDAIPDAPLATTTTPGKSKKKSQAAAPSTPSAQATPSQPAETYTAPLAKKRSGRMVAILGTDLRLAIIFTFTTLLSLFVLHCTWVTSNAYSSPSVVLASRSPDGSQNIIDDFREAYYWLRRNTAEDAKILSWWDYGQVCFLAKPFIYLSNVSPVSCVLQISNRRIFGAHHARGQ
jgi:dolichyl-diphosphooligosaccharide--protein glycosyltransferase